jgi:hypothetical protein
MSRTDRNVAQKMKVLSKKRWICGINGRVIYIIDYAVEDEKDGEGLRGLVDRKSKERVVEEHQQNILKE